MKLVTFLFLLTPALCLAQFTNINCTDDGSADVTVCIQTILDAHDMVFFPPPAVCYKITAALLLHTGQTIKGGKRPNNNIGGSVCSYSPIDDAFRADNVNRSGPNGTRNIVIENMYIW